MSGYWGYYRSERPKAVENGIKAKEDFDYPAICVL
jgi:hypothetical protein